MPDKRHDLNCRDFVDFILAYLEKDLPPDQDAEFRRHMAACSACVTYLETYKETIDIGRMACEADAPVPDDVPDRLVAAILAARRTPKNDQG
jgi:anti-sigma factor RsiW